METTQIYNANGKPVMDEPNLATLITPNNDESFNNVNYCPVYCGSDGIVSVKYEFNANFIEFPVRLGQTLYGRIKHIRATNTTVTSLISMEMIISK